MKLRQRNLSYASKQSQIVDAGARYPLANFNRAQLRRHGYCRRETRSSWRGEPLLAKVWVRRDA